MVPVCVQVVGSTHIYLTFFVISAFSYFVSFYVSKTLKNCFKFLFILPFIHILQNHHQLLFDIPSLCIKFCEKVTSFQASKKAHTQAWACTGWLSFLSRLTLRNNWVRQSWMAHLEQLMTFWLEPISWWLENMVQAVKRTHAQVCIFLDFQDKLCWEGKIFEFESNWITHFVEVAQKFSHQAKAAMQTRSNDCFNNPDFWKIMNNCHVWRWRCEVSIVSN